RAEFVDGCLVEADHGPERPADEVELVLDDEIRRPYAPHRIHLGSGVKFAPPVAASAVVAGPEEPVTLAFLAHVAEERPNLRAPCHHREFVDGGDHHRRRPMVDLLIDQLHRKARMRFGVRPRLAELALRELVAAIDGGAPSRLVDLDVAPGTNL